METPTGVLSERQMPGSGAIAPALDPSPTELHELLYAQRAAFLAGGPPTADVRRNRIDRLTVALLAHADELTAALSSDFGNRPEFVTLTSDLLGAPADVPYAPAAVARLRENLESELSRFQAHLSGGS